jgi:4-hydroxy-tetrahydrodipicolinate synthase
LHITPYYNRPTQEGLFLHFRAVAEVGLPVVLYNVPARTGCDCAVETLARICDHLPQVVAVKEATGSVARTQQILQRLGERLVVLSGEDALNYPLYAVGARGCISVVSNVAPRLVADCWDAVAAGDHARARALHYQSLPLAEALFVESNPIPAKAALAMMGRIQPDIRLPLHALSPQHRERLRAVLVENRLL